MNTPNAKSRWRQVQSGIVVDGHSRAALAVESEVRPQVEYRYADHLATARWYKRWFIRRRIEREVARLIAQRLEHISPHSLF